MTAVALRDQLQAHAAAVAAVADDWASREAPVSFKNIENALRLPRASCAATSAPLGRETNLGIPAIKARVH